MVSLLTLMLPALVSLEIDGCAVGEMISSLAEQSQTKLEVDKAVAAEPITAQFQSRPLDEVMRHVARVLKAEWHEHEGVLRLERSPSLRRQQEIAEKALLSRRLKALVDELASAAGEAKPLDMREALRTMDRFRLAEMTGTTLRTEIDRMSLENPVARAAAKLIGTLPINDLASLERNTGIVYSDAPTPAQRLLSPKATSILKGFQGDVQLLSQAKGQIGNPRKRSMNIIGFPQLGPGNLSNGYGKTLLEVNRTGTLSYTWRLLSVDRSEQHLVSASGLIPEVRSDAVLGAGHRGPALELTEQQQAFGELFRYGYANAMVRYAWLPDGTKISGAFGVSLHEAQGVDLSAARALIQDPVKLDPTAPLVGALLRRAVGDGPLIASIPDAAVSELGRRLPSKLLQTRGDLFEALEQTRVPAISRLPLCIVRREDDWTFVEPYLSCAARAARVDRDALKKLLSNMAASGTITLSAAAEYYRSARRLPAFASLDMVYIEHAVEGLDQMTPQYLFNQALPLLASFTQAQWQAARSGLPLGMMTAAQRQLLERWAYFDFARSYAELIPERGGPSMGTQRQYPLDVEPTELFPKGIPPSTAVTLSEVDVPVVLAKSSTGFGFTMDAESMGLFNALREDPQENPEAATRTLVEYRPGSRAGYQLKISYGGVVAPQLAMAAVRPVGKRVTDWKSLPEAFLKSVEIYKAAFLAPPGPPRGKGG